MAGRGGRLHHAQEAIDEVIDEAERPRLLAVTVDREGLAAQCLGDEVRDEAAIHGVRAGAVRVENADDAGIDAA